MRFRSLLPLWPLALLLSCGKPAKTYVIEIDIDDHGLTALWNANAPNLKRLIREGTFGFTRVDVPTHSNQNNMTLVTGNWPDGHDVPANSYLDRDNHYRQGFQLGTFGLGDYIYYDENPLNPSTPHHVESAWSTVSGAGLGATRYVGELPPWELGADEAHFTLAGSTFLGITVDAATARSLLQSTLRYPANVMRDVVRLDGPPDAGETIEHFTFRDAAQVWSAAAATEPPRYMFVWDFIALDGNPTEKGADTAQVSGFIQDYDDGIGDLLAAIEASPYKNQVDILFTLDHGKVDATQQCALGGSAADGQSLAKLVLAKGADVSVGPNDYQILNEDGDALLYAVVDGAGTAAGAARQMQIAHGLVDLIQGGSLPGVDVTRTLTWDGYRGTRRLHDARIDGPHQADIIVFPLPGWTLNDVDGTGVPGPFSSAHPGAYGRHGGYSLEELYVPLILWGPSFKQGAVLPHPVDHADVLPTAMKVLGTAVATAEGGPISCAFRDDPGETVPELSDMSQARDQIVAHAGFGPKTTLLAPPASQAVVVDVPGLYQDELFVDSTTASHASAFRELAKGGVAFQLAWNRYRGRAENAFELLTGGAPVVDAAGQWVPSADADPGMSAPPGQGRLLEPPAALGTPGNPAALAQWRSSASWDRGSLLSAAAASGFAAGVFGDTASLLAHVSAGTAEVHASSDADVPQALADFLGAHPKAVAVVKLAPSRTADRHASAALAELDALGKLVASLARAAPGALFVLTSDGATEVDEAGGDFYGPQSSRHVPLIIKGAQTRTLVTRPLFTSQPANPADIPATVLFGLGLPVRSDFADGAWIAAPANADGVPQPLPAGATAGHVLLRAFDG